MRSVAAYLAFGLVVGGCGPAAKERAPALSARTIPSAEPRAPVPFSPTVLRRSAVRQALAAGLGAFLQRVELEDQPVRVAGKFRGFRIAALHDREFWQSIDLRPGDVVTRVNGLSIESPNEAFEAFRSLETASELRVDFDRGSEPRVLRLGIVDDAASPAP